MAGEEYLITGKKETTPRNVLINVLGPDGRVYEAARYPIDQTVEFIYHSRAGGFVPPEAGVDSSFSQLHYGEGGFEGMRFMASPYGTVLIDPAKNYARLFHTSTMFNPVLAKLIAEAFLNDPGTTEIELTSSLTPRRFYDVARERYQTNSKMMYPVTITNDGQTTEIEVELGFHASVGGSIQKFGMMDVDTIVKVLAYTGRLVSKDYFPECIEMLNSGYIRPWIWVAGEEGLKIPTIGLQQGDGRTTIVNKTMYFAVATLPWKLYLTEQAYNRGLDVMVSPYPRVGTDMPFDAKIAGIYVNSMMAINLAMMLGFDEILACNREGRVVEGSAENLFVIMDEDGKNIAYTPPLSSGCLPGTNRDTMIRALEDMGMEIRYHALELDDLYQARAILFTGTGAQTIHIRSISEINAASQIAQAIRLRGEHEAGRRTKVGKSDLTGTKKEINGGSQHEIVGRIKAAFNRMLLKDADNVGSDRMIEPVYNIRWKILARLLGLELKDFTTQTDQQNMHAGYFSETINGLQYPEKVLARHMAAARMIATALKKRPLPGKPLEQRLRSVA